MIDSDEPPLARTHAARILVLEADDLRRTWIRTALRKADWDVQIYATAMDAFAAWVGARDPFDLLVLDPKTAGEPGIALWCRMAFLQPGLRVALPTLIPEVGLDGPDDPTAGERLVEEIEAALRSSPRTPLPDLPEAED